MIKHLLKMVWNRKRANVLIIVEIFFSFLVLAAVLITTVHYWQNYHRPLGYSIQGVWRIEMSLKSLMTSLKSGSEESKQETEKARQLYLALQNLAEVEAFAGSTEAPYDPSVQTSHYDYKGRKIDIQTEYGATMGFKDVLGLQVVAGRWFEPGDEALSWDPVVINQKMKEELFGSEDPLGKNIAPEKAERERRVVGVISEYRKHGEFVSPYAFAFQRSGWSGMEGQSSGPPHYILVKVRPGTPASFEEKLMTQIQRVNKNWSFTLTPLTETRQNWLTFCLAPIVAGGIVAVFLLIMVGLGLVGVLWQNVTQRTHEIGLRRSLGGTQGDIHRQVLGELLVIASVGLLLGVALAVQIPLLHVIDFISARVFSFGIVSSAFMIYLLTMVCGLYPSWMAAKVEPAQALHYE
jgi:putative ABC transport system permease protein